MSTVSKGNRRNALKAGLGLDDTLAALDLVGRRRITMMLEMIKAFSEDADEKAAAEHLWVRAARAWYGATVSVSRDVQGQTVRERR